MKNVPKALVIADSAEPKSIDELKDLGVNIVGAPKGAGSILQGIQNVQAQRVSVTKRSTNIIKEYRTIYGRQIKTERLSIHLARALTMPWTP